MWTTDFVTVALSLLFLAMVFFLARERRDEHIRWRNQAKRDSDRIVRLNETLEEREHRLHLMHLLLERVFTEDSLRRVDMPMDQITLCRMLNLPNEEETLHPIMTEAVREMRGDREVLIVRAKCNSTVAVGEFALPLVDSIPAVAQMLAKHFTIQLASQAREKALEAWRN